jgi:hypothetical protein
MGNQVKRRPDSGKKFRYDKFLMLYKRAHLRVDGAVTYQALRISDPIETGAVGIGPGYRSSVHREQKLAARPWFAEALRYIGKNLWPFVANPDDIETP